MKRSYSVRIEDDLLKKLHFLAREEGRSTNSQVLYLIRKAVQAYEMENGRMPVDVETPRKP